MRSIYQNVIRRIRLTTFAKAAGKELDQKQVDALFGTAESTFKTEFLFLVSQMQDNIDLDIVQMAMKTGDVTNLIITTEKLALGLTGAWAEVYQGGGDLSTSFVADATSIRARFDIQNANAVQAVRENAFDLVREVTDDQRLLFKDIIDRGMQEGLNPRTVAIELRDNVGLTQFQEQIVQNYRVLLEKSSAQAMDRQLHDARFDPTIQRAIDTGKPIPADAIDRMVDRYRENWVNYRAENIARTEGLRAASMGLQDGFEQAVERGDIEEDSVIRQWNTQEDGRERLSHGEMNGQRRGLNEPFESGLGNELMEPRDPEAPPEDTVQCRCRLSYRLR